MAEQTIKVGTEFTEIQIPQGDFTLFLNQNSKYFFVSRNSNGDDAIFSNDNLSFTGPSTIYVKGDNPESYVILSDFFKTLPIGTTAVDIATQDTVGLVKGSDTIQIGVDGSANLDFSALFYQQGESIPQGQWRLSPITPNP